MICGRTMGTGVLEYFFECDLVEERQQRARSTTVRVREVSEDDYGLFVWPSSLILAQYLFEGGRDLLQGKRVLELGAGTGVPGIVASQCGAVVVISDRDSGGEVVIENLKNNVRLSWPGAPVQSVSVNADSFEAHGPHPTCSAPQTPPSSSSTNTYPRVIPFSYGEFSPLFLSLASFDLVIASDIFYDNKEVYDDVMQTFLYLFSLNPECVALISYRIRSSLQSVRDLCRKYSMICDVLPLSERCLRLLPFNEEISLLRISPASLG
eukprot:TRINITY_DN856_c0_g1_i2.p1 TRINITY_DN856_c0_g1~~TRINITY_DN856_c0_g1_i2.p1  ORF type:complete len:266 (+),score=14.68 TRINITY_DN856_c0_g1_i2:92-889(+)